MLNLHRLFRVYFFVHFLALCVFTELSYASPEAPLQFQAAIKQNGVLAGKTITSLGAINDLKFSPDGKFLYTSAYNSDALTVFSVNAMDGSLQLVQLIQDNSSGVDGLDGAVSVAISPDGKYVF
ncbi:MAG TPA: beta-propeller fold lactonase family protein, partial [Pseudomonadales bacterium]|nr:beta-propeller fold lactonase family protein [Pseudomonadales bacterium]